MSRRREKVLVEVTVRRHRRSCSVLCHLCGERLTWWSGVGMPELDQVVATHVAAKHPQLQLPGVAHG